MANRRADPSPGGGHLSRFAGTVHDDPEFILAENRMRYEAGWAHRGVGLRLDDWIVEAHMSPPLSAFGVGRARRQPVQRRAARKHALTVPKPIRLHPLSRAATINNRVARESAGACEALLHSG